MPAVAALYRHPVKGFTPEPLESVALTAGGWFPGDRMYAVEDGPSGFDPDAPTQISKTRFTVLMREASRARIRTEWHEATNILSVETDDRPGLTVDLDAPADRARFEAWLTDWLGDRAQGPLRLLAAGERHRFMDSPRGRVSVLNLASLRDLEARLGRAIDPRRFRANILVEGWVPWIENAMGATDGPGEALRIGDAVLRGDKPITRCAATHVDPDTGVRDLDVVGALFEQYGHVLCGLYCSIESSGRIALGDPVTRDR